MKMAEHRVERGAGTIGVFGRDFPENDTVKWQRESVALAIAVPQSQIAGQQDDNTSYLFQLRPDDRGTYRLRFRNVVASQPMVGR